MQPRFRSLQIRFMECHIKKNYLSSGQIDNILVETNAQVCAATAIIRELCWGNRLTELCNRCGEYCTGNGSW